MKRTVWVADEGYGVVVMIDKILCIAKDDDGNTIVLLEGDRRVISTDSMKTIMARIEEKE
jgi:hypothetical protein